MSVNTHVCIYMHTYTLICIHRCIYTTHTFIVIFGYIQSVEKENDSRKFLWVDYEDYW